MRLVISRATAERIERKRGHITRKLVFTVSIRLKESLCFRNVYKSANVMRTFPFLLNFVWMGEAGDVCCEICFVWEQSSCPFLILRWSSRQLVSRVFSEVWIVPSSSGEHGRLGSLKAVIELCIFGPSFFCYTCFRPPITIRSHDLHAGNFRGVVGEIISYHEWD